MVSYVVTGASRGIGLGLVRYLSSEQKNTVFAIIRNKNSASGLLEYVDSDANVHKNVTIILADLTDHKSLKAAAEQVSKATGGTLDVLINNGALLYHERNILTLDAYPDEETLENDMLLFFKTNVIGVTHTINAFIPLLRAGNTKKVMIVSSSMGSPPFALLTGHPGATGYSISKAALNMVVAKFAIRFKKEGFVFLSVAPGLVKTMPGPAELVEKKYDAIVAAARNESPDFPGTVPLEQSVKDQMTLLEKATVADTGKFLHANGDDANTISY